MESGGKHMKEGQHEIRFTLYVDTFGDKNKCVKDSGRFLSAALYQVFGDKFRLMDHRSRPVDFDPDAHDFGTGET